MEGVHSKTEPRHQLLDLIPNNKREWMVQDTGGGGADHVSMNGYSSVEKQLELRLGPPGERDHDLSSAASSSRDNRKGMAGEPPSSLLSLGLYSTARHTGGINPSAGAKRGFLDTFEDSKREADFQPHKAGFFGSAGVVVKEEAGGAAARKVADCDGSREKQQHRVASSPASANAAAGNNSSFTTQSRPSQPPVVGWPPIRSFRKNIAAAKPSSSPPPPEKKPAVGNNNSMLVKINMDGVPIGRKVDLSACSGYDRLSTAVDHLFRGLLAAQRMMIKDHGCSSSSASSSTAEQQHDTPVITGLLDGSGEYTLVYEDNEGDRVLVGDVPWEMFVSTVKRLRVLKSSDLPSSLSPLGVSAAAGSRRKDSAARHTAAAEPKRTTA